MGENSRSNFTTPAPGDNADGAGAGADEKPLTGGSQHSPPVSGPDGNSGGETQLSLGKTTPSEDELPKSPKQIKFAVDEKLHGGKAPKGTKLVDEGTSSAPAAAKGVNILKGGAVMFFRQDPEQPIGQLIFKAYDEEGREVFTAVDCFIVGGGNKAKLVVNYLRAPREKKPTDQMKDGEEEKQKAGSFVKAMKSILKLVKKARNKQVEWESNYPEITSCLKFLAKKTIPFPANVVVQLPAVYDSASRVYKAARKGSRKLMAALITEGSTITMWSCTCVSVKWLKEQMGMPSFIELGETLWEESYSQRRKESWVPDDGDRLLIAVVKVESTGEGNDMWFGIDVFEFEQCDEHERNQNAEEYSRYLPDDLVLAGDDDDWVLAGDDDWVLAGDDEEEEEESKTGMKFNEEENEKFNDEKVSGSRQNEEEPLIQIFEAENEKFNDEKVSGSRQNEEEPLIQILEEENEKFNDEKVSGSRQNEEEPLKQIFEEESDSFEGRSV